MPVLSSFCGIVKGAQEPLRALQAKHSTNGAARNGSLSVSSLLGGPDLRKTANYQGQPHWSLTCHSYDENGRFMGRFHTIVCVGLIGVLGVFVPQSPTGADEAETRTEPMTLEQILEATPRDVLSLDIMALPGDQRSLWLHGAMAQMTQTLAGLDDAYGKCAYDWYFRGGNGPDFVLEALGRYPNIAPPASYRSAC